MHPFPLCAGTGSTDDTISIVKDFFKKQEIPGSVANHAWQDFGHNRNLCIKVSQLLTLQLCSRFFSRSFCAFSVDPPCPVYEERPNASPACSCLLLQQCTEHTCDCVARVDRLPPAQSLVHLSG